MLIEVYRNGQSIGTAFVADLDEAMERLCRMQSILSVDNLEVCTDDGRSFTPTGYFYN